MAKLTPASVSAPETSIGPSSVPAGMCTARAASAASGAISATISQSRGWAKAPGPCAVGRLSPPPKIAISSGVSNTTTSTRTYCMNATSRSSAPSSSAIVTIPEAPPAIIPSVAVGRSSSVQRASAQPVPMLSPSVAALTISTGSQSPASALSASLLR